ncbi:MAG: 30S ribosomal protein S9 [Bacteriovoracaceae bacterium]|nr:30S ribosomal protein S9 [Bacteriovoracaceae bacterium]
MATKGKTYLAHTVGRRKSSVARIYISEGTGKLIVNKKDYKEYFPMETSRFSLLRPLTIAKVEDKYDIRANVVGGGVTGQTGAIRLGIARALIKLDPTLRTELKHAGLLTRDPREVERKKYGRSGARKRYQFSKR